MVLSEAPSSNGTTSSSQLVFNGDGLIKGKTDRIKMILDARQLPYDLVDLYEDPEIRSDMEELSGDGETLPQLFIDGDYLVGGLEELQYLHDNDLL